MSNSNAQFCSNLAELEVAHRLALSLDSMLTFSPIHDVMDTRNTQRIDRADDICVAKRQQQRT